MCVLNSEVINEGVGNIQTKKYDTKASFHLDESFLIWEPVLSAMIR